MKSNFHSLSLFALVFICSPSFGSEWKSLDKELVLRTGPKSKCPEGRAYALSKKNIFLLGQNHNFSLEKTKTPIVEKIEEGCTYKSESQVLENKLVEKTERTKCPKANENGTVEESVELKNGQLIYKNVFINEASKRLEFECLYQ